MSIIAPFDSSTAGGISVDAITTLMGESGTRQQILEAFPAPTSARMPPTMKFCKDEETGTRSDRRLGIHVLLTYPALLLAFIGSSTNGNSGAIEGRARFFVIMITLRLKSNIPNLSRHVFQSALPPDDNLQKPIPMKTPRALTATHQKHRSVLAGIVFLFTLIILSHAANAANIWDGGGADGNWATVENWDNNALPGNGTTLTFAGNTQTVTINNLAATLHEKDKLQHQ
jgi:hypothetical protein